MGAFWHSFGSFWVLLGVSCELSGALRSTKLGLEICVFYVLGLGCLLFAAEDGLGSADVVLIPSRCLLGSMLSLQTDAPIFKNVDVMKEIIVFQRNQGFLATDGFENVVGLDWARFGSCWVYVGSCWGLPF